MLIFMNSLLLIFYIKLSRVPLRIILSLGLNNTWSILMERLKLGSFWLILIEGMSFIIVCGSADHLIESRLLLGSLD